MCGPSAHTRIRIAFVSPVFQAPETGILYFSHEADGGDEGGARVIRAVLFDLDDTLLRLNLTAFIARYVAGATRLLASAARMSPAALGIPYVRAFLAMDAQDREDSLTNERLFNKTILESTGIPLDGARAAVEAVHDAGLVCALATNPTFSLACDRARMGWAGVSEDDFALVSTYSNSTRCKPSLRYYQEFANLLGVRLEECLMVGNDAARDIVRPDCGLRTAYVGHARPKDAVWRGPMERLARELPDLVERLNESDA